MAIWNPFRTPWLELWNPNLVCEALTLVAGARGAPTHCKTAYKFIVVLDYGHMVGDALRRAATQKAATQLTAYDATGGPPAPFVVHEGGVGDTPPTQLLQLCVRTQATTHTHTHTNWCHVATLP